jgi:o-succinylbenzoate synthase
VAPPAAPLPEPLPPVAIERLELVTVPLELARPLRTAAGERSHRDVLLVHVAGPDGEGWAECVAEPDPTYAPETTAVAALVLRDHLAPLLDRRGADALDLGERMARVRGNQMSRAALELAVLDAQLRAASRSLASWLGATAPAVVPGAAVGLHDDVEDLVADARAALAAGAGRVRVKVAPGRAARPLAVLRAELGGDAVLQADANGSFRAGDRDHEAELAALDDLGLACLEQPFAPDDLLGHARLAERLSTPICLDESVGALGDLEAAAALGALDVLCLKAGRVGGWATASRLARRCTELGLGVWVGGMLETGVGRAANVALAALDDMTLPPDLDPRPRFAADLADPLLPADGLVAVPDGPGTGATPADGLLAGASIEVIPA